MKSSTLRRSNLTREKMAMISALVDYNKAKSTNNVVAEEDAINVLWQRFNLTADSKRNPRAYFSVGFLSGVIVSLIMATFICFFIGYSPLSDINFSLPKSSNENVKFTFIPADQQTAPQETAVVNTDKEYVVQAGDSLEDISIRFYGKYDEQKLKQIQVKNNLKDLNSIKIGQKLLIPVN